MSTYVMSDIHGCYDEMIDMFNSIHFDDDDQLIMLGDYIDRGRKNYKMLKWIENVPYNILLLKGNHEAEFSECISLMIKVIKSNNMNINFKDIEVTKLIFSLTKELVNSDMFDHYNTIYDLIFNNDITLYELLNWKKVIDDMPYTYKMKYNNHYYRFVHAGYIEEKEFIKVKDKYSSIEEFYLYARDDAYDYGDNNKSIIFSGHTPTIIENTRSYTANGSVFRYETNKNIFYNIDCGISYRNKYIDSKLCVFRIDDNKCFYI